MYFTIKSLHLIFVAISFMIFISRGILMIAKNDLYRKKFFRIVPPVIDTLLLVSGITLMLLTQQYPTNQNWLLVKLSALVIYIILGIVALNRTNSYKLQVVSFIAATTTIVFMATVALTHHPLGFISLLL